MSWVIFATSAVPALFGQLLKLDNAVLNLSLFTHIGQYPRQDLPAEALI